MCKIVYFMTGSTIPNCLGLAAPKRCGEEEDHLLTHLLNELTVFIEL